MNLAYIVSSYKLPDQLIRLVLKLNSETSHFFIHVDRKTDDATWRRMSSLDRLANVHFLPRHKCHYGGFGHVRATIKGICEAVQRRLAFDYTILLTGQDYPIKSNQEIDTFFSRHEGQSFMEYFPLPYAEWDDHGGIDRLAYWHLRLAGRHLRIPGRSGTGFERRFPSLQLFGGSAYWCLSRECTEYVYRFLQEQRPYTRFFEYVNVPEEIFFHTIVMNSSLTQRFVNDDLRFLEWRNPAVAGGPAVLRKDDFGKIIHSSKLFARKFDVTQDAEILDLIDDRTRDD